MPQKKKAPRRRRAKKKVVVPRGLAAKRRQEISTKVFYFKSNGTLGSNVAGLINVAFSNQRQQANPDAYNLPEIGADFDRISRAYNEYKVLCMKLELYPSNVGTESDQPGISSNPFNRGNCCTYIDNAVDRDTISYNAIDAVMNRGSCFLISSRRKHTRVMWRPKGNPEWGCCDQNVNIVNRIPDSWWGKINLLTNDATPNMSPIWFWKLTAKVIFRGRSFTPGPGVSPFTPQNQA